MKDIKKLNSALNDIDERLIDCLLYTSDAADD